GGRTIAATTSVAIAKVTALGNLDQAFGQSGRFTFIDGANNTYLNDLKLDAAGKLVGVGYVSGGINNDVFIFRLNTNGTLDNTFDADGRRIFGLKIGNPGAERLYGLDLQSDGKILACGTYIENGSNSVMYIRFQENGKSDAGFGGQYGFVLIPDATLKTALFSHLHVLNNERAVIVGRTQKTSYDALVMAIHTTEPFPAGLETPEVTMLQVYPNPARESIRVAEMDEPIMLTLYSTDGQAIHTWAAGETQLGLPATLSPGMYLLRGRGAETVYQARVMIY
ncbi:MAG: T9SS type A sorting domain-containing protein, partial [Bacteroidia bacterium]